MAAFHIAQFNYATALYPLDDPRMAGFTGNLERINALAEAAPGFVWRLIGDGGADATHIVSAHFPNAILNMSVWRDIESLFAYVYKSGHAKIMAGRRAWFERPSGAYHVLWWVPAGHTPTIAEAAGRIARLNEAGPTPDAFTFKQRFAPPQTVSAAGPAA